MAMRKYQQRVTGNKVTFFYSESTQSGVIRTPMSDVTFGAATLKDARDKVRLIWKQSKRTSQNLFPESLDNLGRVWQAEFISKTDPVPEVKMNAKPATAVKTIAKQDAVRTTLKADQETRKLVEVPSEDMRHSTKFHVHFICLILSGIVFLAIIELHINNPVFDSFGPLTPNMIQEAIDCVRKL